MGNEIVAGLDDSPSGKAALDWAAQHARSTSAVLRAVHALDWPGRPPARASLGIMDPIGGPHCDEADALSPHCGPVGAGGAWAASGAGRSRADLNAEHPARHQYHQPPLNILAAFAGTSHSRSQSRCTSYVTALTTQHCRSWHACVVARSGRSAGPATGPTADQHHWTGR